MNNKKSGGLIFLVLFITGVFIIPFISSCGKSGASKAGFNTQLQILNLSPDLLPVNLYIDFIKQNTSPYYYPQPSGYFYLSLITPPLQIRSAVALAVNQNILSLDSTFKANHKYSLFITGLAVDNSVTSIFTEDDSTTTPDIGFGKIRVVNASIQNPALDIYANKTKMFSTVIAYKSGIPYKAITPYVSLPVGNYNFQLTPTGSPSTILLTTNLQNVTIQDGRLYTIYTYGIISHSTDSAAFGAGVLTNR